MKYILFSLLILCSLFTSGQQPVSWTYFAKKISDKVYEVHLKATINNGWHIYSQKQPKDAIGLPTFIKFTANPLLTLKSNPKEIGKLEKVRNEILDIENHQYKNEVDFVQLIILKSNVKTNVAGCIEFMACTDERCLPPATVVFNLPLQ